MRAAADWKNRPAAARWFWRPLSAFAITRLGIALVALLSAPLVVDSNVPPYHIRPDNTLLDVFGSRWDTGFYLSIATEGYRYEGVSLPSVAFFPLLPVFIRAVALATGDPLVAGLIVTNLALLAAVTILYRLVEEERGAATANRAVWYLLIFPTSFFGSAIYSESLFLLGAVGSLYAARKHAWGIAALVGLLTGLTRFTGVIAAALLAVEWWTQRRRSGATTAPPPLSGLAAPVAVLIGTAIYLAYLQLAFGDALAFARASAAWARLPRSPFETIGDLLQAPPDGWGAAILAGRLPLDNWIDLLASLTFLGLGGALLFQRRWSEGVFVVLGTLIPLSSGLLMSQRRYVWVLFPVFILLARWGERPWLDRAITALGLMGLGLFTVLFANWYWVG
ncbi:MAG TPA: mannosyltransferase family protein [Anaerolineae bacterium]|nr:mannosyltransferase family protein [Anaerolineae bacterium]